MTAGAGQSAQIRLREFEESDVPAVYRLLSDMAVIRYMLFPLYSQEDARRFVRDARTPPPGLPYRSHVRAIADRESGRLLGLCGLVIHSDLEAAEAWYLVDPRCWGRGFATQAARLLLDTGFGDFHLHRIWATCCPDNPASARVLEKAGMRREGLQRKDLKFHGEWRDTYLYAILREEWEPLTPDRIVE